VAPAGTSNTLSVTFISEPSIRTRQYCSAVISQGPSHTMSTVF